MSNEFIIYTRWVAFELRKSGFEILRVEPNPNKPEFDCYVFADSPGLREVLTSLKNSKGGVRNGR